MKRHNAPRHGYKNYDVIVLLREIQTFMHMQATNVITKINYTTVNIFIYDKVQIQNKNSLSTGS